MKNGHALRSIDSSFKQRYTQYYVALNTSLLSVLECQLRPGPRNHRHKNNRPIPHELTETGLFWGLDRVIHLTTSSPWRERMCDRMSACVG